MNSILTKVYIIFVRKYLYEFLKIAWQVLCGFFRRCLVVSMSFSTTKPLSQIPCNEFAFTEKHPLRCITSIVRCITSQNHHNR